MKSLISQDYAAENVPSKSYSYFNCKSHDNSRGVDELRKEIYTGNLLEASKCIAEMIKDTDRIFKAIRLSSSQAILELENQVQNYNINRNSYPNGFDKKRIDYILEQIELISLPMDLSPSFEIEELKKNLEGNLKIIREKEEIIDEMNKSLKEKDYKITKQTILIKSLKSELQNKEGKLMNYKVKSSLEMNKEKIDFDERKHLFENNHISHTERNNSLNPNEKNIEINKDLRKSINKHNSMLRKSSSEDFLLKNSFRSKDQSFKQKELGLVKLDFKCTENSKINLPIKQIPQNKDQVILTNIIPLNGDKQLSQISKKPPLSKRNLHELSENNLIISKINYSSPEKIQDKKTSLLIPQSFQNSEEISIKSPERLQNTNKIKSKTPQKYENFDIFEKVQKALENQITKGLVCKKPKQKYLLKRSSSRSDIPYTKNKKDRTENIKIMQGFDHADLELNISVIDITNRSEKVYESDSNGLKFFIEKAVYQGNDICIKIYNIENGDQIPDTIKKEIKIYRNLSKLSNESNCFIKYYGTAYKDNSLMLIMDRYESTLLELIDQQNIQILKENENFFLKLAFSLLNSYATMAKKGIYHNDINPRNIAVKFYGHNWNLKLINFSNSFIKGTDFDEICIYNQGANSDLSSEKQVIINHDIEKSEIFSLGIILYQSLTYKSYRHNQDLKILYKDIDRLRFSRETKDFLKLLLANEKIDKLTFSKCLSILANKGIS